MRASSGPRFWSDFFGLFSKIMKKTKPESLAGVWEICDVRQRHIEIWCSSEFKVDHFRVCTGPRPQSVDETRSKWISSQTLVVLTNASRPGLPGESSLHQISKLLTKSFMTNRPVTRFWNLLAMWQSVRSHWILKIHENFEWKSSLCWS